MSKLTTVQTITTPIQKFEVDLNLEVPLPVLKQKLEKVTGIPAEFQKLRHDYMRIFVGDKRTNIKFGAKPGVNAVWNPNPTKEQTENGLKAGDSKAGFVHIGPAEILYPGCNFEGRPTNGYSSLDSSVDAK